MWCLVSRLPNTNLPLWRPYKTDLKQKRMSERDPTKTGCEIELNECSNLWDRHSERVTIKTAGLSYKTQLTHWCSSGKGSCHTVWVFTRLCPLWGEESERGFGSRTEERDFIFVQINQDFYRISQDQDMHTNSLLHFACCHHQQSLDLRMTSIIIESLQCWRRPFDFTQAVLPSLSP